MKIPRRGVLKRSAVLAAAMLLPRPPAIHAAIPKPAATGGMDRIEASVVSYLSDMGYRQVPPESLVTEDFGFNGGLRYDDTGVHETPGTFFVQPCARTGDIAEKHRLDVLPIFHILRFDGKPGEDRSDAFARVMGFLTGPLALDPTRLAFVSIPPFAGLRPQLEAAGLDWARQVFLRNPAAALKAGDGSGFFRHPGDPTLPAIPTAAIYYWMGRGPAEPVGTHPLPDSWTEIGELFIAEKGISSFGLGVERLAFAATGNLPTWDAYLPRLLAQIDRDSPPGAPPPGRALFANS